MPHQTTLLNTLYVDTIKNREGTADLLEGVNIKSSDITTGSKFLGANNDGSCSWQTPTNDAVPAPSASGNLLTSDGTDWTSVSPSFQPGNAILTTIAELSPGTSGNVLTSDGADWTSAALGTGSFQPLDTDLTTIAALTPGTSNNVLTSNGTNWTSAAVAGIILSASSDPTGTAGEVYFNTTSKRLRVYDGTDWVYVSPVFSKGGTISQYISGSTSYRVHTFLSSGTFTVKAALTGVDILVVGAGGGSPGGAGGGGQVRTHTGQSIAVGDHTVTIGDGGVSANNGDPSQFGSLGSAIGGGRGGGGNEGGQSGASGGGGGWGLGGGSGGSGTAGNAGSAGDNSNSWPHWMGAGGGCGDAGQGTGTSRGGNGCGNVYRDGTTQYYGGGGGGGVYYDAAMSGFSSGGSGGGGRGRSKESCLGEDGTANTGGGGGAGCGDGGSGIVVIRIQQQAWSGD
jgi:hypothetical protein